MLDRGDHIVNQIISDNNHGNIVGSRGIIMYINDINLIKLNIFFPRCPQLLHLIGVLYSAKNGAA